jgi:hypothetical protein
MGLLAKQLPSLSSHIPSLRYATHAALVLPQAGLVLETGLRELARGIFAFGKWCGQPVTLRLFSIGIAVS